MRELSKWLIKNRFTNLHLWKIALSFALLILQSPISNLQSQNAPLSNLRSIKLENINSDTLVLDSLTIVPNSVQIIDNQNNTRLDSSEFKIKNNLIALTKSIVQQTSYTVHYRVLPFDLGKKTARLDSTKLDPSAPKGSFQTDYRDPSVSDQIFDKGLDYTGNYTQGFSVGNNQNLVVNQNFNLNLAGKLGDLDILASMTDNNLPIQAEGNTAQLRDFDRIFVQLKKQNHTLILGDFDLLRPQNTYFVNYLKRLQGVSYASVQKFKTKTKLDFTPKNDKPFELTSRVSAAVARGKFARVVLPVSEGNQGAYRLLATEGVNFAIILAGTEKVFFDGKLLTRGDENDYVVDYNRGDITFTPKRLVTKDSRIVVEFEYADQSYLRSTVAVSNSLKINNLNVSFNFYSEQDAKNSSGSQTLDSLDKVLLRTAGNAVQTPLSIRQISDGFRSDRIQYAQIDTVSGGKRYSILRYSINPDSAKFTASFSPVGQGRGNYVQDATAANGRVYRWVAPDSATGQMRGAFEPVKQLVPPNRQQLTSLGIDYQGFRNTRLTAELAMSNYDANRFSTLGDSVNAGFAIFTNFQNQFNLDKKANWSVATDLKWEATQTHFRALNPYRPAEFTRDWNLPAPVFSSENPNSGGATIGNLSARQTVLAAENLLIGTARLARKDWFSTTYEYSSFNRQLIYEGQKQALRFDLNRKGWRLSSNWNELNTEGVSERSKYSRPNAEITKEIGKTWRVGARAERERNERKELKTDTLLNSSFGFDTWNAFFQKNTEGGNFGGNFAQRFDFQLFKNALSRLSQIDELGINGNFAKKQTQNLTWNLTYRNLKVSDTSRTTLRPQQTYLGRVEYNFQYWKNLVGGSTLYEIGSGQEQKLEYQYVRVNKGEGNYVWRNRNNDTIPQLDEFEIAPFADQADYVRVALFTNQFVRTNNVSFSQSLRFDPKLAGWAADSASRFQRRFSKFSTASNVQISRRVKNGANTEGVTQWNPFELNVPDVALVGLNLTMRNSLYFNRSSQIFDFELAEIQNRNRAVLVTGFEERSRNEWLLRTRWNIGKRWTWLNSVSKGEQSNTSEAFKNRNYRLEQIIVEPQLWWQLTTNFRLQWAYKFKDGVNILKTDGEKVRNHDLTTEVTWNRNAQMQLRSKFSWIQVQYTGQRGTPIEFALLEGLQSGQNYLWNVSFDQSLSQSILFSVSYDGRKTGGAKVIHVGRAQVRANF